MSVLGAIGIALYSHFDKKGGLNPDLVIPQQQTTKAKASIKKDKRSKIIDKFEIKSIEDHYGLGVINLFKRNAKRSVVSISTTDFELLTDADQVHFENALIQFAIGLNFPIQFFTTTVKVSTKKSVENVEALIEDDSAGVTHELRDYASMLRDKLSEIENNAGLYVRKSYCVFGVDGIYDDAKALKELEIRKRMIAEGLETAHGVSIKHLHSVEIAELLSSVFNKGQNVSIENLIGKDALSMYVTAPEKEVISLDEFNKATEEEGETSDGEES
jgi:hypothetical protein